MVTNGVRQGGILSPTLFSVYLHELDVELTKAGVGCNIAGHFINHLLYADDLCLLCPSAKSLQKLLDICSEFSLSHDILYNCKKTVCLVVAPNWCKTFSPPPVKLCKENLVYVQKYVYLGHVITSSLSDNDDIDEQRRKLHVCIRVNMIIRNVWQLLSVSKKRYCSKHIVQIYILVPCGLYITEKCFDKMRVMYNNAFRWLMHLHYRCSASGMFVIHGVRSFGEIIRQKCVFFYEKFAFE